MTAVKKFMFDTSFDPEHGETPVPEAEKEAAVKAAEEEPLAPTFSEEDLEIARNEGVQRGREEATREQANAVERQILDTMTALGTHLQELFKSEEAANKVRTREAIAAALSIVRKLFPHLSKTHGLSEVESMVLLAMAELTEESKITITLHPDTITPIKEKIGALASEGRFKGTIEFHPDETLEASDSRITWGLGGIERSTADLWHKIDEIVEENMGSDAPKSDTAEETNGTNEIASEDQGNDAPAIPDALPDSGDDHG